MSTSIIVITGLSALQFWLDVSARANPNSFSFTRCERIPLPGKYRLITNPDIIKTVASDLGLNLPLNMFAPDDSSRHAARSVRLSLLPGNLPNNSFIKLQDRQLPSRLREMKIDIYVASPELCFLLFAGRLSFVRLIELGCNLCAGYAHSSSSDFKQIFRKPITNASMLSDYIAVAERIPGCKKARRAIRFIYDSSNSPIETKLAVIFALPYSEGGYNLPGFCMNERIVLSEAAAASLGIDSCLCDIVWNDEHAVVEYDSNLTHLDKGQHGYDKAKANALSDFF